MSDGDDQAQLVGLLTIANLVADTARDDVTPCQQVLGMVLFYIDNLGG